MKVLAFDCSGAACSAAIAVEGTVLAERFQAMSRGQSETLLPQIRSVLAEAGLGFGDLDAIATVVGPGSFTGLRIGLAAARGLALATGLQIVALTAFEAYLARLSAGDAAGSPVAVAIDSRRGPVFAQLFDAERRPVADGAEVELDALAAWLPCGPAVIIGNGAPAFAALQRPKLRIPAAHEAIRAGAVALAAVALGPAGIGRLPSVPLYLRPPDVTMPKRAIR